MSKSKSQKSKKGKEEMENKKVNINNAREDSTQGKCAHLYFRLARRRGVAAPGRNNRMTESATKETREAIMKYMESG